MAHTRTLLSGLFILPWCWSCVDLGEAQQALLPGGAPFVVRGTATIVEVSGAPCLVWIGENGVTYHLFQDPLLDNESFDRITTPDTTSRLVIATRSDLVVACQVGTVVEVQEVLEIIE